ncbi:MAG: redoxin domain-containing protein [Crocinitomicaceae bacterium]|nr:redoxin domain-containing protein [Crocinitomicaceae bacterium]
MATLEIPAQYLPGEFVLRLDYKENEFSQPYPSEKNIYVYNQNLQLWIHPLYSNNPDSTYFQPRERENTVFLQFAKENAVRKESLGVLQSFLLKYDKPTSKLYKYGSREYEQRRNEYNRWIDEQVQANAGLFVSTVFRFQHVPQVSWKGTEEDRLNSRIEHYFDGMSFQDTMMLKTREMNDWMNQYVNLFGAKVTSIDLRDSMFTAAGRFAIEKVKSGHPRVYGWMVDYFYRGYESFNIEKGIKMLEPYLNDPNCLTKKREAINKRIAGMESLQPGTIAPDFILNDVGGKAISFHDFPTEKKNKLVLFWSADCGHCQELMKKLYPWFTQEGIQSKLDVIALSLDESETEIEAWNKAVPNLTGFHHQLTQGGINSAEANAYFVLATPVMVLVNSFTNEIIAIPESVEKLEKALK